MLAACSKISDFSSQQDFGYVSYVFAACNWWLRNPNTGNTNNENNVNTSGSSNNNNSNNSNGCAPDCFDFEKVLADKRKEARS